MPEPSVALYELNELALYRASDESLLHVDSMPIAAGEFTCITGPSGAGKSSLLFCLAGLNTRYGGQVLLEGKPMQPRAATALRRERIGLIFQQLHLFDELNALDNAALSAQWRHRRERATIIQQARTVLHALGIDDLTTPCSRLSGGQRQRVAVARALAGGADIILADEPTASLDAESAQVLLNTLIAHTTATGKTLIACSHDDLMIQRADCCLKLEGGEVQVLSRAAIPKQYPQPPERVS